MEIKLPQWYKKSPNYQEIKLGNIVTVYAKDKQPIMKIKVLSFNKDQVTIKHLDRPLVKIITLDTECFLLFITGFSDFEVPEESLKNSKYLRSLSQ